MKSYLILREVDRTTVKYALGTGNSISIYLVYVVYAPDEAPAVVGGELIHIINVTELTVSPDGSTSFSGDVVGTDQWYHATIRSTQIIDGTVAFGTFDMKPRSIPWEK